jgi:short-chain fatty acids transporter
MLVAFFNWGLGLIFGALLARKVAEHAQKNGIKFNYPIIGAAGYAGLMVWHGGISGSAPIKINEDGHIAGIMKDVSSPELLSQIPSVIDYSETIFSNGGYCHFRIVFLVGEKV